MEEEKKEVEVENTSHEELNKNNTEEKKDKKIFKKNHDEKLLKEIEELKTKNNDLLNKVMYSQAEFANYKKRKEQEVSNMLKYSNMDIVLEILPIVDNFERAIKLDDANLNDELSKFLSGFKMIYTHLVETLKKFEVKEIECLDKTFDHNTCQALMTCKVEGIEPGIVVEVLQKGYMLKDKMIRPALVKVSE
ncbi:MAG: nucleotide exchange factor GrpE [Erysipelotrichaceae bacterium]|nr:nucleotide exchange factor GrpE [Erysipelotrichaceae bacterium]